MPRIDTRNENERRFSKRFEVVKSSSPNPDATVYDSRIAEVEREVKPGITTPEGYAAFLKEQRDEILAQRDKAALDKEYTAAMYQDSVVQKLLRLQAYYESDESVDAKLLQKVTEAVEQYTTPGASRVVAEDWANKVFAAEQNRRAGIEAQLNERSEAWKKDAAKLQADRLAIDGLPETTPAEPPAPVVYEKNVKLKSETIIGKAWELFIALPPGPDRDAVDAAIARKEIPGELEAVIEKYEYAEPAAVATTEGGNN